MSAFLTTFTQNVKKNRIVCCNKLVEQFDKTYFFGEKSKIPDNAAVLFDLNVQPYVPLLEETNDDTKKRFNLRRTPPPLSTL